MKMGGRIALRLAELGWQQVDLIRRVPDLEPATLSALVQRDSSASKWSDAIAGALGVSHSWLVHGTEPKLAVLAIGVGSRSAVGTPAMSSPERTSTPAVDAGAALHQDRPLSHGRDTVAVPLRLMLRELPVSVSVSFQPDAAGLAGDPSRPGAIAYPTPDPAAYAIECIGDGLAPRAEHGEYLIVSPAAPVRAGDQVIARMADGTVRAAVLLYERAGRLHLARLQDRVEQLPPLPLSDVTSLHRVIGVASADLFIPR